MSYQNLNIDLVMGTNYLINESAYFLGGMFAANEHVVRDGKMYWMAPVRHNPTFISDEKLEEHFTEVSNLSKKLGTETIMSDLIKSNNLDSGKFNRLTGFATFFESKNHSKLVDMIPTVKEALFNSSHEVKRCFIVGMFDGRGSIDFNSKTSKVRYIVLDCDNNIVGKFLSEVIENFDLEYNYNQARERLEGGRPRKEQLRILGREDFIGKIGFISPNRFDSVSRAYDVNECKIVKQDDILNGLKVIVRR